MRRWYAVHRYEPIGISALDIPKAISGPNGDVDSIHFGEQALVFFRTSLSLESRVPEQ